MDTIHSAAFYVLGATALGAALTAALTASRQVAFGALALLALAAGLLLADLSAGFAALLVFLLLLAGGTAAATSTVAEDPSRFRQAGALAAAVVFGAFAYAAYRGEYHSARFPGGSFDASALGRHLVSHDPLGLLALAAAVLIGTGFGISVRGGSR